MYSTKIPFAGFYNSLYDSEIDDQIERESDSAASNENDEGRLLGFTPVAERLTSDEHHDLLWERCDFDAMHEAIAQAYAGRFFELLRDEGVKLSKDCFQYEKMISPREYNFETDVIFVRITLEALREIKTATPSQRLDRLIKARCTSRDGFISYYPNSLSAWPSNILKWDVNHFGLLVEACTEEMAGKDWEETLFYRTQEDISSIFQENVDWPAYEEDVRQARLDKRFGEPAVARDNLTMDLFKGQ